MRAAQVIQRFFSTPGNPVSVKEVAAFFKSMPRQEYLNVARDAANQMGERLEVDDAKAPVVSRSTA